MRKRKYKAIDNSRLDKYFDQKFAKIILTPEVDSLRLEDKSPHNNSSRAPKDKCCNGTIGEIDNPILDSEIAEERFRFGSSLEPYSAFSVFVKCVENGYYPPSDVLKFISGKFNKYLNCDRTLDEVMDVSKRSKQDYKKSTRNTNIVREISVLNYQFGISTKDAFYAVHKRYESAGDHLTCEAIQDIYYREGKKLLENSIQLDHDDFTNLSELEDKEIAQWRRNFLSKYPNEVIELLKRIYSWGEKDGVLTNIKPNYNISRFEKSSLANEFEDDSDD